MTGQRLLLGVVSVVTALLLQITVISRLPLPGATPDLLLVLVVAFGMAEGSLAGAGHRLRRPGCSPTASPTTRSAGSPSPTPSRATSPAPCRTTTELDAAALRRRAPRGAAALGAYAAEGLLLGDPRVSFASTARAVVSSVPYDVVLTPFVVPLVAGLVRRLDADPLRRL